MGEPSEKRGREYRPDRSIVPEIAAGGVVRHPSEPCLLLLHDEKEDRWCLPKGHLEVGETLAKCAVREVEEETGLREVEIRGELGEVSYRFYDPKRDVNVSKVVYFFFMCSASASLPAGPVRDHTVVFDRAEWVSLQEAMARVPYPTDLEVLRRAGPLFEVGSS